MATRSKALVVLRQTTATTSTPYATPAGETTLLKSVYIYNATVGASVTVTVSVRRPSVGSSAIVLYTALMPSGGTAIIDPCWIVMHPADEILVTTSSVCDVRLRISGAELEGVTD